MGSHQLETLPATPRWKDVVGLLGDGAGFAGSDRLEPGTVEEIAAATLDASLSGFERAKNDEGLGYVVYLFSQLTHAARQRDFANALAHAGFNAPVGVGAASADRSDDFNIFDLVAQFTDNVDRHLRRTRLRTDISELVQQAAAESLTALCRDQAATLFGSSLETIRDAIHKLSTKNGFSRLTQDFFARLTRRYLIYHLSRELSNHVGRDRRFRTVAEHNDFLWQLDRHCRGAARILDAYAGEWYSKHNWLGGITQQSAQGFAAHALDKMQMALMHREGL